MKYNNMYNYCPYYMQINHYPYKRLYKNVTIKVNNINITTKEINYDKEYIKGNIRIPVIKGIRSKLIEKNINSSLENDILQFSNSMEEEAKSKWEESRIEGITMEPFVISSVYEVTYNKNNIISISIVYYEYINGRSSYIKTSYNYNIVTGRSLSLDDLFKPGVDFIKLINNEIRRELRLNRDRYFQGTYENFKGITEDQPFYLENDNLVIYFGFHQIAPTEAGIPVIKLPFRLFRNSIKDKFLNGATYVRRLVNVNRYY